MAKVNVMNKVILMGRLTRDPEVRYTSGENQTAIARYTLAVDRRMKRQEDEQTADFINCIVFGRGADFAEKYLFQGTKVVVCGRLQTGSYTNKEGRKVYTTDVVVEEQEFAESKNASANNHRSAQTTSSAGSEEGFMNIPESLEDDIPFK